MSETDGKAAKILIDQAEKLLQTANKMLRCCDDNDLRAAGLHWQYLLIACGDPRGGQGTKPIFNTHTSDRDRARAAIGANTAQNYSIHYRNDMRSTLRAKKMPEPMIWERWPAISAEERQDRSEREDAWYSRRSKVRSVAIRQSLDDPWTSFLRRKAQEAAKRGQQRYQALMQDPEFISATKARYEYLATLDLGI